jgi:protein ImuB
MSPDLRIANCELRSREPQISDSKSQIKNRKSKIANPLTLVRTVANRQEVVAVSDEAYAFGIRSGMTLAQARALCAHVEHAEHDPHKDAVALEALGRWMMRFSPIVMPLDSGTGFQKPVLSAPPGLKANATGILLDLSGCERTLGGLENILTQVSDAMKRFRVRARLAVAPTPGAAWAAAFAARVPTIQAGPSGPDPSGLSLSQDPALKGRLDSYRIIEEPDVVAALEDFPPIALRIAPETAEVLHHLGIDTIGRLMRLPRESLPARFGNELLTRLDQALGKVPEPLVPLEPFSPIQARMDFDGPVDSLEAIWLVFKKLLTKIVAELLKRGHGAREIEVEFYRPYAVTLRKTIRLSRPSRDVGNLFNLMRCAMETLETDVGFLGIKLIVARSQRVADEQIQLLEHEEFAAEAELSQLIERLKIRLGEQVIAQPALVESYVPEKAHSYHGRLARVTGSARAGRPWYEQRIRPLHLLNWPQEIGVIVTPSHDRDGRPVSFTWQGSVHRLLHSTGPERIAGQWWQGHHKTRDYFDVEDSDGARFWIFRVMETGKWYVHGEFE